MHISISLGIFNLACPDAAASESRRHGRACTFVTIGAVECALVGKEGGAAVMEKQRPQFWKPRQREHEMRRELVKESGKKEP